jgi:hypothetical protein
MLFLNYFYFLKVGDYCYNGVREREFGSPSDWLGIDGYPHRTKNY